MSKSNFWEEFLKATPTGGYVVAVALRPTAFRSQKATTNMGPVPNTKESIAGVPRLRD